MLHASKFLVIAGLYLAAGFVSSNVCPDKDSESLLQPGYEYEYFFKSEAFAEAVGTTDDRSKMTIECTVHLSYSHDCYYKLMLEHCKLSALGGPPDKERAWINNRPLEELSKYPVMFTLSNGDIRSLYKDPNDPLFAVNIKRAALSAFVFKMSAISEDKYEMHTDIHGTCPYYSVPMPNVEGGVKTLKDMMFCAYPSRPDWQFSPWSIFWNMTFIQYQINSTMNCEYRISLDQKRLEKLYCKERHAIGLESTHRTTTAVQTNIYYHMSHVKSKKVEQATVSRLPATKTSIQFEFEHTPDPESQPTNFMSLASKMLSDLVEISQEEIRLFTIPKFTDFVAWLRSSNDLGSFTENVKSCSFLKESIVCTDNIKNLAMSYLSDALVQCNTVPCIKAFSGLVVNGDVSLPYVYFVLYSWTNMHFTKPQIIAYLKDICIAVDTRQCWLALGAVVNNYHKTNFLIYQQKEEEVDDVIAYFHSMIGSGCAGPIENVQGFSQEELVNNQITFLKAAGNTRDAYLTHAPDALSDQIFDCITKENSPMSLKIAAFEMLYMLGACSDFSLCNQLHQKLAPILHNSSVDLDLRIRAYNQLMLTPEKYNLVDDVILLLKTEENSQVLSYIASDLIRCMSDNEFRREHSRFVTSLTELLEDNDIVLEALCVYEEGKSYSSSYGQILKFYVPPMGMELGFGAKFDSSSVFSFYNILPKSFRKNLTFHLFNKVINFFEIGGYFEGLHGVEMVLQKMLKDMNIQNLSQEKISDALNNIGLIFSQFDSFNLENSAFNKSIINNIRKIHNMYKEQKPLSKPQLNVYLRMLGTILNYWSSDDLQLMKPIMENLPQFLNSLKDGFVHNNTRVIRVIEAYHQVPTMMGMSLNWTTNATFAFSMRSGLKLAFEKNKDRLEIDAAGFFHPSAALTFLNRMVLDFPTHTQIGVQANSSGYTSTQWQIRFEYSDAKNVKKLVIEAPRKPQKILELFRTNQLIKHDSYDDIPDWDIKRYSTSWCLGERISSALGLQVCHERSYPKVTHLIKPWALMAGWCKWTLELLLHDNELKSFNFQLLEIPSEEGKRDIKFQFDAIGTSLRRDVLLTYVSDASTKDVALNIDIPEIPDFKISYDQTLLHEKKKIIGFQNVLQLRLTKGMKYELTYRHEARKEKMLETTSDKNKSPKSKELSTMVQENQLKLETPFNEYKWIRKSHSQSGNVKNDLFISFENHDRKWNWLRQILPADFWENNTKAWLRLQLNRRHTSQKTMEAVTANMNGYLQTPHSNVELISSNLKMTGREQFTFSLAKTALPASKLNSFVNFSYDVWISESDHPDVKKFRTLNLTIPGRSWGLQSKRIVEGNNVLYDIILAQAKIVPKDPSDDNARNYIGWWSEDVSNIFDLQQQEVKFKAILNSIPLESSKVLNEVKNINPEELQGLGNKYTTADINFYYPSAYQEEVIKFDGKFITSGSSSIFRFQKDFVLFSSYNNMQLDSHSVYRAEGNTTKQLSHSSFLTHTTTDTKAFYNLDYKMSPDDSNHIEIYFNHNISSHVYNMVSNVTYRSMSSPDHTDALILHFDSSSPYWRMLNMHIQQIIEFDEHTSRESMNFTHPLMLINVTAQSDNQDLRKTAEFIKLPEHVHVMILNLRTRGPHRKIHLTMFGESEPKNLIYERLFLDNFKKVKVKFSFPRLQDNALGIYGEIIDPHHRIWKADIHPSANSLFQFFDEVVNKFSDTFSSIAKDAGHPLNRMLQPAMKMPLAEYLSSLKENFKMNLYLATKAVRESVETIEPFYQLLLSTFLNVMNAGMIQAQGLYSVLEQKSITIWAIKYFKIPELLQQGLTNFPKGISVVQSIFVPSNQKLHTNTEVPIDEVQTGTYHASSIFKWNSFDEYPTLSLEQLKSYILWLDEVRTVTPHLNPRKGSKLAMIYGPGHVYTFNGQVYEFPEYPSSGCAYLLAHDVYRSSFSVLSTATHIHLLFPEMAVSINSFNEVFVNGSDTQTSLPVVAQNEKVIVKREGDILFLWSSSITVLCDGQNQLCVLELSGWNGGGTIGLLGNSDGEVNSGYVLPDGSTTTDIVTLAQNYELTGKSECQEVKYSPMPPARPMNTIQCERKLQKVCASYFNKRKQFADTCVRDLDDGNDSCYTVSAISALCYYSQQKMVTDCGVRKPESNRIRHKLEVVVLINEQQSMIAEKKSKLLKGIESVLNAVEQKFESNGYSSITYSLVTFGGSDARFKPSIQTHKSNIWVPLKVVTSDFVKKLDFKGTEKFNPVSAVKYAAEVLGHDTFDTKVFIVFTDEDIQDSDMETLQLIQDYFDKNHITLYTISQYRSIEKGKKVYGVRADGLMFPSSKEDETYLEYPRGDLAKLTSGTRGSIFLKKFVDANGPALFFTEFAEEVWAKVRKEVQFCRRCKTVRSGWWYYYNECHIVDC